MKDGVAKQLIDNETPARAVSTFQRGLDRNLAELAAPSPSPDMALNSLLARVEDIVDLETRALRNREPIDFAEISRRKSRSLLELSRAARALTMPQDPAILERLAGLRKKLLVNREQLGIHLAAAQEVARIINSAILAADSDGTYSTQANGAGA